jgi:hypothetical protein
MLQSTYRMTNSVLLARRRLSAYLRREFLRLLNLLTFYKAYDSSIHAL